MVLGHLSEGKSEWDFIWIQHKFLSTCRLKIVEKSVSNENKPWQLFLNTCEEWNKKESKGKFWNNYLRIIKRIWFAIKELSEK